MLPTVPIEVECAVEEELEGLLGDEVRREYLREIRDLKNNRSVSQ